jgi:putative membrane protein
MRKTLIAMALVACLSPPAFAQRAKEPAAAQKASTGEFVREATSGSRFQLLSSQLALTRPVSPQVRQFARNVIRDHQQEDRQLRAILRKEGLRPAEGLTAKQRQKLDQLRAARGRAFEREYINDHVAGHAQAMALFRDYARNGQNPQLRQFAERRLPVVQEHGRKLRQLEARVAEQR